MVNLTTKNDKLVLEVQGWDKLWALKSRLEIPRASIRSVRADPTVARGWWKGFRAPGTYLPGVIIASTFYQDGKRIFWDVNDPEKTIVIDLMDDRYDQLIVEVADPKAGGSEDPRCNTTPRLSRSSESPSRFSAERQCSLESLHVPLSPLSSAGFRDRQLRST